MSRRKRATLGPVCEGENSNPRERRAHRSLGHTERVNMNVDQRHVDIVAVFDRTQLTTLSAKIALRPGPPYRHSPVNGEHPATLARCGGGLDASGAFERLALMISLISLCDDLRVNRHCE